MEWGARNRREKDFLEYPMLQKSASFKAITGPVVTVVLDGFGITEREVGNAIAAGLRADLLLVRQNPIEDIRHLRTPVGVMVRGEWFARDRLDQLLASLARD